MVAMAQDYGGYPHSGVYAVSTGTVCGWRGGAGDTPDTQRQRAAAVSQQVIWFPPAAWY